MTVDFSQVPISRLQVPLPRPALRQMLQLVRLSYLLSQSEAYRQLVLPQLPETARFDPGHAGLMMGYDFHLGEDGPRLIEVNTNAGGSFPAWLAEAGAAGLNRGRLPVRLERKLLASFRDEWRDFCADGRPLQRLLIVDEQPEQQHLYPEMRAIAELLQRHGLEVAIADPAELQASAAGVRWRGQPVDLIYNRHCDFFLEEPAMAGLRAAYLARQVCLSPNPLVYGLLADKRRLCLWSDAEALATLPLAAEQIGLLTRLTPHSRLLADLEADDCWTRRKRLVFKPVTRFGSRGVLLGKGITRHRFAELDPQTTLVQQLVPPSLICDEQGRQFKTDLRLYVYRNRVLGLAARLYRGQVTNLRTEGGGFAAVRLV